MNIEFRIAAPAAGAPLATPARARLPCDNNRESAGEYSMAITLKPEQEHTT